jgi:transcriptional regulator with XRE-family HTH domain
VETLYGYATFDAVVSALQPEIQESITRTFSSCTCLDGFDKILVAYISDAWRCYVDYREIRRRFARRLQELRIEQGITQEQLAETIGKSTEHISLLERGERAPSFELLLELAHTLDVKVASLLGEEPDATGDIIDNLLPAPVPGLLPQLTEEPVGTTEQRNSDLERLNRAFNGIMEMQHLANEYGIGDILQDNGGKVLQVLILLGLKLSPGREGNDAVDVEGNEYELKTVNRLLNKNAGITTHHHLNKDILNKYRRVKAWYVAIYEGVELREIYKIPPADLEPVFSRWEQKIEQTGIPLNNPKIPIRYVRTAERVYPK